MSLFERFMLWAGFVRTRLVLKGVHVIDEHAVRCAVGYEIFGRKYQDILEHEIIHNNFDPTLVSVEEAASALRKTAEAFRRIAFNVPVLTEGKIKSGVKARTNTKPNQPPPSPAKKAKVKK